MKSDIKELKKKHFIQIVRRGRDRQPGWRKLMVRWQLVDPVVPHLHVDKLGGATGKQERLYNLELQSGEIKPQNP